MIAKFADRIALSLYYKNKIDEKELDTIAFALELIITHILCFASIMIIGIINNHLSGTLLFLLCFIFLRKENIGYHASTFSKCFLLTNLTYVMCVYIMPYFYKFNIIWIILLVILYDLIIFYKKKFKSNIYHLLFLLSALIINQQSREMSLIIISTIIIVKLTNKRA